MLPTWSAYPATSVPIPKRMPPIVATKRGPFLSTSVPPNAAASPMINIRSIKVYCTVLPSQPCMFINGILKTDHAYTVPRQS